MKYFIKLLVVALIIFVATSYYQHRQSASIKFTLIDDPVSQQKVLQSLLANAGTPEIKYEVVKLIPHVNNTFTEGLFIDDNQIYESSGLYNYSHINVMNKDDGKIVHHFSVGSQYFSEGITMLNGKLYQLTYREHKAFVYDKNTFQILNTFEYPVEGWGLTNDGSLLIISDGSANLYFVNPENFHLMRRLTVTDKQQHEINALNELEYIDGKIYANVWPTDIIIIISPQTGVIEGWLNLHKIRPDQEIVSSDSSANGIAFDPRSGYLLVTGKEWPFMAYIKREVGS